MLLTPKSRQLTLTESAACIAYDGLDMLTNCGALLELQILRTKLHHLVSHLPEDGTPQQLTLSPRESAFLHVALHLYQLFPEIELEFKLQAAQLRSAIP